MRKKNLTPFLFGYKATSRRPPQPEVTCVVRGRFLIGSDGSLAPHDDQGALSGDVWAEDDDDRSGGLVRGSDFAEDASAGLVGVTDDRGAHTQLVSYTKQINRIDGVGTVTGVDAEVELVVRDAADPAVPVREGQVDGADGRAKRVHEVKDRLLQEVRHVELVVVEARTAGRPGRARAAL